MSNLNLNPTNWSGNQDPMKKLGQFRLFINMIRDHFNKKYTQLSRWVIPALAISIVYVISPFDIIPDIPIIGWIDDAAIVALVYKFLGKEIKKYEDWRAQNR